MEHFRVSPIYHIFGIVSASKIYENLFVACISNKNTRKITITLQSIFKLTNIYDLIICEHVTLSFQLALWALGTHFLTKALLPHFPNTSGSGISVLKDLAENIRSSSLCIVATETVLTYITVKH